jgi:hypothetical protein
MNPGPPVNYTVSQSELMTEQFLQLVELATQQGRHRLVLRAAGYIVEELAYDPNHFGESRGVLAHMEIDLRIAFAPHSTSNLPSTNPPDKSSSVGSGCADERHTRENRS